MKNPLFNLRKNWQRRLPYCARQGCAAQHSWWYWLRGDEHGVRMRGAWYCSVQCFEIALAQTILRLRTPARQPSRGAPHRLPLGLLLLSRGQLTNRQLREALEAQRAAGGGRIGEWLQRLGFASEQQITAALGLQWACPVFPLHGSLDPASAQLVPMPLLQACRMLPVHYSRTTRALLVAFCERIDYTVLYLVERMLDCHTEPCLTSPSALQQSLARLEQQTRCDEIVFDRVSDASEMARITRSYVQKLSAEHLHIAACGEHLWVRLSCRAESTSLVFRAADPPAESQPGFRYQLPFLPVKVGLQFADDSLGSK